MQPLSSNLDLERYAALVDENELAVEHYRRMHQIWLANSEFTRRSPRSHYPKQQITYYIEDGEEDEEDADDLWRNLNSFVHAMC